MVWPYPGQTIFLCATGFRAVSAGNCRLRGITPNCLSRPVFSARFRPNKKLYQRRFTMQITKFLVAGALVASLSGCLETDGERAIAGAAGGAVLADVFDQNVVAGAALGAAGGAFCDDLNIPGCRRR
jgi:osmotically inducible lipoprotein OsmB